MNKKNKVLLFATTCTLAAVGAIVVGSSNRSFRKLTSAETPNPNKIVLNKNNTLTSEEKTAGSFTRNTAQGNPVTFACDVQDVYSEGFFQTRKNGHYISNTTAIKGLKNIKIYCNDDAANNRTYRVLFGNASGEYIYSTEEVAGNRAEQQFIVPQYETPFSYFKIETTSANWTHFKYVEIEYTCSDTLVNRGSTFNETDGGAYDFTDAVDVSTGVVDIDIKWTDLGSDNGKTCISFFDQGWANSFGYKTVYENSKTGDIPGLTVTKLSDGYTRFSWKLSEMTGTGTLPTSIKTVHFQNKTGWTTSEGYFEVNSSVAVAELKGTRFTNTGVNIDLPSSVSLSTGKVQVDLYYTSFGNVSFAAMADWNGNYYGYFSIQPTGNNAEVWGVQVISQVNGFVRLTIEASKLSAGKTNGTPTAINMIYLRGNGGSGYTTASGYVDVSILAN